jgi:hypothetical protein
VFLRSLTFLAVTSVFGCGGRVEPPAPAPIISIEVRDATSVVATIRPDRPCRASVGPIELIVGKDPFVAALGETEWTGERGSAGIFLLENGRKVARVFPETDATTATVFGQTGEPLVHVDAKPASATITDGVGRLLRTLTLKGDSITIDKPQQTITGTRDLVLAGLIASQELEPEVRMLAACDRVLRQVQ